MRKFARSLARMKAPAMQRFGPKGKDGIGVVSTHDFSAPLDRPPMTTS